MATITPLVPTIAGAAAAFAATVPAGDEVSYNGGDLVIEFDNGHASPITITIAPTITTGVIQGAGPATVATRALVLAAGAHGAFRFKSSDIKAYLNASKRVPLVYTGGDVALLIRALSLK